MRKYIYSLFVLIFTLESHDIYAQSDKYLIEEYCSDNGVGTICSRTYSTNALDTIKLKKNERINDLHEVTVSEDIRQIEEANVNYDRPLPYKNEEEKQQYIKSAHYQKLLKKLERPSDLPNTLSENSQSLSKKSASPGENKILVYVFYKESTFSSILSDLNINDYLMLNHIKDANWVTIGVNKAALERLYLNPNVIEISSFVFGSSL